MAPKKSSNFNRRKFMKGLGASAGALTLPTSGVSASGNERKEQVLDADGVSAILAELGNPSIEEVHVDYQDLGKTTELSSKMVRTTLETKFGDLMHAEFRGEGGKIASGETSVQFHFDDRSTRAQTKLPTKFRTLPSEDGLVLIWHEGEVVVRRNATTAERNALIDVAGLSGDQEKVEALYCSDLGGFYLNVTVGGSVTTYEVVREDGTAITFDKNAVNELRRNSLKVVPPGPTTQGQCADYCFGCVGGGGSCVVCSSSCTNPISLPVCAACIVGVCGGASYFCSKCISCA